MMQRGIESPLNLSGICYAEVYHGENSKREKVFNIPLRQQAFLLDRQRMGSLSDLLLKIKQTLFRLFVRTKDDILKAKQYIKQFGGNIPVIAKIEKPQAVENLDSIITASDGVMVARGDLGIELSLEKVPIVQKQIIKEANAQRKAVIVATQMLESMIEQPIPTRAEVSDVANAIIDGADAVMLSGETAMGKFPPEAVNMMSIIAENLESSGSLSVNQYTKSHEVYDLDSQAICSAIIRMLDDVEFLQLLRTKNRITRKALSKQTSVLGQ
jgi:pyruvate kinase